VHYCDKCGFEIPNRKIHKVGGKEYCKYCYEEINEEGIRKNGRGINSLEEAYEP
jgi:RNA polymerase-binding transcription factor DksA